MPARSFPRLMRINAVSPQTSYMMKESWKWGGGVMSKISLQQIDVPEPCPARWDDMQGDDVSRYCNHCHKSVYDFSAMTRDEAELLVCRNANRFEI